MKTLREQYSPLNQDLSSDGDDDNAKEAGSLAWGHTSFTFARSNVIILFLVFTNVVLLLFYLRTGVTMQAPPGYAEIDPLPVKWTRFDWWTEYSDKNATKVDALWDAILPSHGFVAMDTQWATRRQWPESMRLPSDESKSVYLLEAYHQLHCIRVIRKTFWELVQGEPTTYAVTHSGHCFDMIRQYIQCNADNTPLYVFGDDTAGDGQLHKCRDWNTLRDFATEHTACYRDSVRPIVLGDHFGYCDDGNDGVIEAKKANVTHGKNASG